MDTTSISYEDDTNPMDFGEDRLPSLPITQYWSVSTTATKDISRQMNLVPISSQRGLPSLNGVTHRFTFTSGKERNQVSLKRKGWQRPGPGPKRGKLRIPNFKDIQVPILLAVIHLTKEAIYFQQLYAYRTLTQNDHPLDFIASINVLNSMEQEFSGSHPMKKQIWPLTHQLGVPAFLIKLKSPYYAISLHFSPNRTGDHWYCSQCETAELYLVPNCMHSITTKRCIRQVADNLGCTVEFLLCSMTQSSAFNHIPETSSVAIYGYKRKSEFAVVRKEQNEPDELLIPMTSKARIHVTKRISLTQGWKCLGYGCSGISTSCTHHKIVDGFVQKGNYQCFSSIQELVGDSSSYTSPDAESELERSNIPVPRYSRPMIPSERAFHVDFLVNRNARNNETELIRSSETCHCGRSIYDDGSSEVSRSTLRVESSRCFINYHQEVWYCQMGHCVTPQDSENTRDGLLWISKDTAFTEVFLFELLLHMTLGGTTISSLSDLRSQILFLQTDYFTTRDQPRSTHTIRRALIAYTMAVVKSVPAWVFRCLNCSTTHDGRIYYDKLSFDGQHLGFNIRRDVRYDFYGKPTNPWRRPVDRCTDAAKLSRIIESKHLRGLIMETLRVRDVPPGCNAVQALCRSMMRVPLRSKEAIHAAISAVKLFDGDWKSHLAPGAQIPDETSFKKFTSTTPSKDSTHPLHFVTEMTSSKGFEHGLGVIRVFRDVLDCSAAAAVISVLISDLRSDLKIHIPIQDVEFLQSHALSSYQFLGTWLSRLSKSETWTTGTAFTGTQDSHDDINPGVSEHATCLDHPLRPPFTWKQTGQSRMIYLCEGRRLARVRQINT